MLDCRARKKLIALPPVDAGMSAAHAASIAAKVLELEDSAHLKQFTAESLDFGNNFFETTFLLRTGELARALLLYYTQAIISTTKNAGVLARAPNTSCFYQLFRLFPILIQTF